MPLDDLIAQRDALLAARLRGARTRQCSTPSSTISACNLPCSAVMQMIPAKSCVHLSREAIADHASSSVNRDLSHFSLPPAAGATAPTWPGPVRETTPGSAKSARAFCQLFVHDVQRLASNVTFLSIICFTKSQPSSCLVDAAIAASSPSPIFRVTREPYSLRYPADRGRSGRKR